MGCALLPVQAPGVLVPGAGGAGHRGCRAWGVPGAGCRGCRAQGVPGTGCAGRRVPSVPRRVSIVSEAGQGTLTIRDVKEADQGAYTCEAINTLGMVFGIPDSILTVTRPGEHHPRPPLTALPHPIPPTAVSSPAVTRRSPAGPCPEGHFQVTGTSRCLPCFCFGVTTACRATARHRHRLRLRFDRPDDFKGEWWGQGTGTRDTPGG